MKSKGAPYSLEELEPISDQEYWSWIYAHRRPKKQSVPEIYLTGFTPVEKEKLCGLAEALGFRVRTWVNQNLTILCVGDDPGPVKLEQAKAQNVTIMPVDEFVNRIVLEEDEGEQIDEEEQKQKEASDDFSLLITSSPSPMSWMTCLRTLASFQR